MHLNKVVRRQYKEIIKGFVAEFLNLEDSTPKVSTYSYEYGAVNEVDNLGISTRI